jgi:hypothetical protein
MVETDPTGLVTAGQDGAPVHICGTSFAAPFVARTLAELDLATEQFLAPSTLADHFKLGRLREGARTRFEMALSVAQQHSILARS